jgi:hypothetical protein
MKSFEEFLEEKVERTLAGYKVSYDIYSDSFKPGEKDKAQAKFDEMKPKHKNTKMWAVDQAGVTIPGNVLKKLEK